MARSAAARRRANAPHNPYRRTISPTRLGDERLRFTITQGARSREVGDVLTSVRWDDTAMELTGSVDAQVPVSELRLGDGDRLRCEWAPSVDASFRRVWTMALDAGEEGITRTLETDGTAAALASTLSRYRGTKMDFSFRKDKKHPRGWRCDQVTREVARRTGMPVGQLAKGTHYIKNLVRKKADPIDVILIAYRQERENSGRRFFATWDGKLNLTVLKRSREMLDLLPVITSASYVETRRPDFATVIDVKATTKKGKRRARKINVRYVDKKAVRQFGQIIATVSPKGIDSEAEARKWAKASIARRLSPKRELTITVPLLPTIRRGDAVRIDWVEKGLKQIVYVRSATHEWVPGGGSTNLVLRFDDPYKDLRSERVKALKKLAAKKNKRKAADNSTTNKPATKNRSRRS